MTSVNFVVGCLAVMGSVGDPPQDIQHLQQQDGAPPEQVRPPQDRTPLQPKGKQNIRQQHRSPPQRDPFQPRHLQIIYDEREAFKCCSKHLQGLDPGDTQFNVQLTVLLESLNVLQDAIAELRQVQTWKSTPTEQQPKEVSNIPRWNQEHVENTRQQTQVSTWIELPTKQPQQLFQNGDATIPAPQFSYLMQCMILAGLLTSILSKKLSKNRQSDQATTGSKSISERQTNQQQTQANRYSQQVQHYTGQLKQEARQPRSTGLTDPSCQSVVILETQGIQTRETAILPSAVPFPQSVEIQKTQHNQARVEKQLAAIRTRLQAVATESAKAACKQGLFNTCAGGLRAAALC